MPNAYEHAGTTLRRYGFAALSLLILSVSTGVAAPAGAHPAATTTTDAVCGVAGTLLVSPGLSPTPQPETFTLANKPNPTYMYSTPDGPCPLAPVRGGHLKGTFTSPSAWCDPNTGSFEGDSAVGRLKMTWPDGSTSVVHLRLRMAAYLHAHGKVRAGSYAGDSVRGTWVIGVIGGFGQSCTDSGNPLTKLGIGEVGTHHGIKYSTLSFEHSV